MKNQAFIKGIAVWLALSILFEIISPTIAMALTSGPNSPEFSSFEPVATTDMVNLFSGDFTYNLPVVEIPGSEGGGYSLSLSYHSGVGAEEEASWVGYGWTLNPGAINRNLRGFPDEYNGTQVTYYNRTRPNWSTSASEDLGIEAFSKDVSLGSVSASSTIRYNNYQGFSKQLGFGLGVKGMVNLGMNVNSGEYTFSASVNPAVILSAVAANKVAHDNKPDVKKSKLSKLWKSIDDAGKSIKNVKSYFSFKKGFKGKDGKEVKSATSLSSGGGNNHFGLFTHSEAVSSLALAAYRGVAYNWKSSIRAGAIGIPVGMQMGHTGHFNLQANAPKINRTVYGYMYNPGISAYNSTPHGVMADYYLEKNTPYSKRDFFIGIPFNNADNFMVTGEGLSGGFRMYDAEVGHYYPNFETSETKIRQMGVEFGLSVGASVNVGVGFDFGVGKQIMTSNNWEDVGNTSMYSFNNSGMPSIFRFNNDLGGEVSYSSKTYAEAAGISSANLVGNIPTVKKYKPTLSTNIYSAINNTGSTASVGRSSYITSDNQLSNFSIVNSDGNSYVYGQGVKSRKELSIQVGINSATLADNNKVVNNFLAQQLVDETDPNNNDPSGNNDNDVVVGEKRDAAYAASYLLTEINTPDYVDVGNNGPDANDFGGWTKFSYKKVYGIDDNSLSWYKWRIPYSGLSYDKNEISDKKDDLGGLNKGEKEVYYLEAIETKTHIAFFVTNKSIAGDFIEYAGLPSNTKTLFLTGSGVDRLDGLGGKDGASNNLNGKGDQKLQKLEKIVLFSKSRLDKPIKTVHFDYTNSLVRKVHNNTNTVTNATKAQYESSGKLTLKRVWSEYENIKNSKIAPYIFSYEYKNNYPAQLKAKYPDVTGYGATLSYSAQNPDYEPYNLDMWGNHQYDGANRHKQLKPWVYQGVLSANADYDPAAWQLKQIRLPSGGEIHIQYEEKEYSHVQDRKAMAMVSLLPTSYEGVYYLNLADIGVSTNEANDLAGLIRAEFTGTGNEDKKMLFKFLYGLFPGIQGSLNSCNSEYITGYAHVSNVVATGGTILIQFDNDQQPRKKCLDFVRETRGRKPNTCNTETYEAWDTDLYAEIKINAAVPYNSVDGNYNIDDVNFRQNYLKPDVKNIFKDITKDHFQTPKEVGSFNPELSYLRIPLTKSKKGGGIRVKRLLMYDAGMESGDAALYGTEYAYETKDFKSSGVATNEPSAGRDENALVEFMKRAKQGFLNRAVAGKDKKEVEGPLGESIIQAPSIGYSRVVSKNIHSGKTGTGFVVNEYFTAQDYPYDRDYPTIIASDVSGKGVDYTDLKDNKKKDYLSLPAGIVNYKKHKKWFSQGFRFVINSMHGQPKSTYTYGGETLSNSYLTSAQEFNYFEPGEKIKMMQPDGSFVEGSPGKEMDIAMEMKRIHDKTLDLKLEMDVSVTLAIPPPIFVSAVASFDFEENEINTHATTKVMRYPAIAKSIKSYADGAWNITENLAFDPNTGNTVLTRTKDAYDQLVVANPAGGNQILDGSVYSLNLPASWYYPGMGPRAKNAAYSNQLSASAGTITSYGANGNPLIPGWFSSPAGVTSANVTTYSNLWDWSNPQLSADYPTASINYTALNKIWRPQSTYVYKENTTSAVTASTDRNFKGGIYNMGSMFPGTGYNSPGSPWLKASEVTLYSPNGMPLEEKNILNVYSVAKYGYNNTVPVLVGNNAEYASAYFLDFETTATFGIDQGIAHSGNKSLVFGAASVVLLSLIPNQHLRDKGASIKGWLKSNLTDPSGNFRVQVGISGTIVPFTKTAQVGEWTLFEAKIPGTAFMPGNTSLTLFYDKAQGEGVWLDDFRFQPTDAQLTSYVYDVKTLRPVAQFDDRNFGLFYQYNAEDKLIRKIVETERGVKTLVETQYNNKLIAR